MQEIVIFLTGSVDAGDRSITTALFFARVVNAVNAALSTAVFIVIWHAAWIRSAALEFTTVTRAGSGCLWQAGFIKLKSLLSRHAPIEQILICRQFPCKLFITSTQIGATIPAVLCAVYPNLACGK